MQPNTRRWRPSLTAQTVVLSICTGIAMIGTAAILGLLAAVALRG